MLHETLEVEVGELIRSLDLKKSRKLGVGDDLPAILLILEVVSADISVDLLAHGSAGELSSRGLTKERSELITDTRGLHEARGLAVTRALLLGRLLGSLDLTSDRLLKGLIISLERGEEAKNLLELGTELVHLGDNRKLAGLNGGGNNLIDEGSGGSNGGSCLNRGSLGSLLGSSLLGGSLLGRGGNSGGGGGSNNSLRCTNHF